MRLNDYPVGVSRRAVPFAGRILIRMLERISVGCLRLVQPDGLVRSFGQRKEDTRGVLHEAQLDVYDWRAATLILRQGDVGFAESLRRGWIGCEDLVALFSIAMLNQQVTQAVDGQWWALLLKRLSHWVFKDNSRSGSRRNILSHYDVGNSFYKLWLDPSMSYSSAYFGGDLSLELEVAQNKKYDHILDQLDAQPGQTILEIGCGWGGLAECAAREFGARITGVTLSAEQLAFGQDRLARAGLAERATLRFQDYRDIADGPFDAIVSIEMFEAVGREYWASYFKTVHDQLKPGGRACIQTITIRDDLFERYVRGTDFIQQYIFPGGLLPSALALCLTRRLAYC